MIKPQRILRVLYHYPSFDRSEESRYQQGRLYRRNTGRSLPITVDSAKYLGSLNPPRPFISMSYKRFLKLEKEIK